MNKFSTALVVTVSLLTAGFSQSAFAQAAHHLTPLTTHQKDNNVTKQGRTNVRCQLDNGSNKLIISTCAQYSPAIWNTIKTVVDYADSCLNVCKAKQRTEFCKID